MNSRLQQKNKRNILTQCKWINNKAYLNPKQKCQHPNAFEEKKNVHRNEYRSKWMIEKSNNITLQK